MTHSRKFKAPILLTGFAAFGGERVNPSWETVRRLHGTTIGGHPVVAVQLPTAFGAANDKLRAALARWHPRLVLCLGQAGGRSGISLERIAINLIDARIPDNAGAQPIDEPVIAGAPAGYFATLPLKAMWLALRDAGIPVDLSLSAGSYVCNAVFFALAHELAQRGVKACGGFMHVPYLPSQASSRPHLPSMALETMVKALQIVLRTAVRARGSAPAGAASAAKSGKGQIATRAAPTRSGRGRHKARESAGKES